jgi:PPOX class probable F420-dependent enzyme
MMQVMTRAAAQTLAPLQNQYTVLLTTYRRDGTPVGTPVNIAVEGDHAYVRTWDTAWKMRRMLNNPNVTIAPSTLSGTPTGPAIGARARPLAYAESAHAGALLARKHPFLHGLLVPLVHRLRGNTTVQVELTPTDV